MKKSTKKLLVCGLVTAMTLSASLTALAGTWKQDHIGWWWQEDNGSYPVSTWQWIDGNNDGIAECYYFDNLGYCLLNTTTPDGYTVNADGAWTVNGIIQTKSISIPTQNSSGIQNKNNNSQFQFNSQVSNFMNANSYEEAIHGLTNVSQEWSGFGFSGDGCQHIYERINADNLSISVEWGYTRPVEVIQGGYRLIPDAPETSYGLHEIDGTMAQIFDGLTKDSYTVKEIESLANKLGGKNVTSSSDDYEMLFNSEQYWHVRRADVKFQIGNYEILIETIDNQSFEPTTDMVHINRL